MRPRTALAVTAALAVMVPTTAQAACPPKPLKVQRAVLGVALPEREYPVYECNDQSNLDCGIVSLDVTFSGLQRPGVPVTSQGYNGDLTGTARVVRTYGCQTAAGERLPRYDTTVSMTEELSTRRQTGIQMFAASDTATYSAYAFLPDRQPWNCPAGTKAMTYALRADRVVFTLSSELAAVPSATYPRPELRASWTGAVAAPL